MSKYKLDMTNKPPPANYAEIQHHCHNSTVMVRTASIILHFLS